MSEKKVETGQQLSLPYCILQHPFSGARRLANTALTSARYTQSWADEKVMKRALPLLAPGTFKANCAIYQRGASDAPGEFRRAGVNEASNDNLAAEEDCGNARGERSMPEDPRLCCSALSASLFLFSSCIFNSSSSFLGQIRTRHSRKLCNNDEDYEASARRWKKGWRIEAKKRQGYFLIIIFFWTVM